jgi:hypothetical protein
MAMVRGRLHEVKAWDGVPGMDFDQDQAEKVAAVGVPVIRYRGADAEGVFWKYRVPTPLALLWPELDLMAWAASTFDPAELQSIFRLQGRGEWRTYMQELWTAAAEGS